MTTSDLQGTPRTPRVKAVSRREEPESRLKKLPSGTKVHVLWEGGIDLGHLFPCVLLDLNFIYLLFKVGKTFRWFRIHKDRRIADEQSLCPTPRRSPARPSQARF